MRRKIRQELPPSTQRRLAAAGCQEYKCHEKELVEQLDECETNADEEKIDAEMIDKMKQRDQLEAVLEEFAEKFPEIKKRLIDERDIYLAQRR